MWMDRTGRGAGRLSAGVAKALQTKDPNRVVVDPLMIQYHINTDQLQGQQPKYTRTDTNRIEITVHGIANLLSVVYVQGGQPLRELFYSVYQNSLLGYKLWIN